MAINLSAVTTERGTVRATLTVTGADVGSILTVSIRGGDFDERPIRGWDQVPAASGVVVDHEFPLNVDFGIYVREGDITGPRRAFGWGTIRSDTPLIGHPISGRHVPVTIADWPDHVHERRGQSLPLARSRVPVVIDGHEQFPTSTIRLIHNLDPVSSARLADILGAQSLLLVRPSCTDLPMAWVSVRSRRRGRFSKRARSAVVDELDMVHIDMPDPSTRAIGATLGQLHMAVDDGYGRLSDIAAMWPTLRDVAAEVFE